MRQNDFTATPSPLLPEMNRQVRPEEVRKKFWLASQTLKVIDWVKLTLAGASPVATILNSLL